MYKTKPPPGFENNQKLKFKLMIKNWVTANKLINEKRFPFYVRVTSCEPLIFVAVYFFDFIG